MEKNAILIIILFIATGIIVLAISLLAFSGGSGGEDEHEYEGEDDSFDIQLLYLSFSALFFLGLNNDGFISYVLKKSPLIISNEQCTHHILSNWRK